MMDCQTFKAYILGTMLEADRLALAERYFADDELFDQLLVVEADLLNQYVCGRLGPEERTRFERYLQYIPDRQHKIGVASALMRVVSAEQPAAFTAPEPTSLARPKPTSWWHSILMPVKKPQVVLLYSAAVLFTVSAITVPWLFIYSRQLSKENEQLRAKVEQLASDQQTLVKYKQASDQQNADQWAE